MPRFNPCKGRIASAAMFLPLISIFNVTSVSIPVRVELLLRRLYRIVDHCYQECVSIPVRVELLLRPNSAGADLLHRAERFNPCKGRIASAAMI